MSNLTDRRIKTTLYNVFTRTVYYIVAKFA